MHSEDGVDVCMVVKKIHTTAILYNTQKTALNINTKAGYTSQPSKMDTTKLTLYMWRLNILHCNRTKFLQHTSMGEEYVSLNE